MQAQIAVAGCEAGQGVDFKQARVAFVVEADVGAGDIEGVEELVGAHGKVFEFLVEFGVNIRGTDVIGRAFFSHIF